MTIINTNVSALLGLNSLRLTGKGMETSLARLSSGLRINYASDDPSGLAIATKMEAQIGGIRASIQNAEDAVSLIHTADGALAQTTDILMRMRDLAVAASNEAVLTSADNATLNTEFQSLMTEISRKAQAITFNTKNLFDGTFSNVSSGLAVQIGPDNGTSAFTAAITITAITHSTIGLSGRGLTTPANANVAISCVQAALDQISDIRAALGIQENLLSDAIDDLSASEINLSAARSRIVDADMAVEISEFTRLQILQQSGTAILAQANSQPQSILQLLG